LDEIVRKLSKICHGFVTSPDSPFAYDVRFPQPHETLCAVTTDSSLAQTKYLFF
jgi:hypothetical protein